MLLTNTTKPVKTESVYNGILPYIEKGHGPDENITTGSVAVKT